MRPRGARANWPDPGTGAARGTRLTMSKICLIAAMDRERHIGNGPDIPWRIPGEQKRFKDLTMHRVVIMGRKTHESIGRPLPGRTEIVLSRSDVAVPEGTHLAATPEAALALARSLSDEDVMIAGGEQVYRLFLPLADRLYLTRIDASYQGDIFFPAFDEDAFDLVAEEPVAGEVPYTYQTYERRR